MIHLDHYRWRCAPVIKQWCLDRPSKPPHKHISGLADYLPCPTIAVCHFMLEIFGPDPEILRVLAINQDLYNIEVDGILET